MRSDALKMIYAARRMKAEPATDIGAWKGALRALSLAGIFCNLAYLGLTTNFFEQLSGRVPEFRQTWVQVLAVFALEHLLIVLKLLIDFLVPDIPDNVKVKQAREAYVAKHTVARLAGAAKLTNPDPDPDPNPNPNPNRCQARWCRQAH